tara:strand:+ start:357 stop:1529 length:1173 start_codon:yes stop_codon:yes gene_type:complete
MTNSEKNYDLYNLIDFFLRKFVIITISSLLISIIFISFFINEYLNSKTSYLHKYELAILPETYNEFALLSKKITSIRENKFLYEISSRLKFQYYDHVEGSISNEDFLLGTEAENFEISFDDDFFKVLYFNYFKNLKPNDNRINISYKFDKSKSKISSVSIKYDEQFKDEIDITSTTEELISNLNNYIRKNIEKEITTSFKYYEIDKKNLLKSIIMVEELTSKVTERKILNDIDNLNNALQIAEILNIELPYSVYDLDKEIRKNINSELIIMNTPDDYLKGTDVLTKQIQHLDKKLKELSDEEKYTFNEYFYDLIESDFFIKSDIEKIKMSGVMDENYLIAFSYPSSFEIIRSGYSFSLILVYFLMVLVVSIFIFSVFFLFIENYNTRSLK